MTNSSVSKAVMASIHTDHNISPEESRFPTTIKHEQQFSDVENLYENADNVARFTAHLKRTIRHRAETPSLSTGSATSRDYLIDLLQDARKIVFD
jgi:hypothetical protein